MNEVVAGRIADALEGIEIALTAQVLTANGGGHPESPSGQLARADLDEATRIVQWRRRARG